MTFADEVFSKEKENEAHSEKIEIHYKCIFHDTMSIVMYSKTGMPDKSEGY